MTSLEIKTIMEKHCKWLEGNKNGKRADFRDANLGSANLRGANLGGIDFRDANLGDANLGSANLRGANFGGADLKWADLRCADLRGANLRGANLGGADLRGTDFWEADLREADLGAANLRGADLRGADLRGANLYYPIACPEKGSFIGWKKASVYIVELEILSDAKRSSGISRKCRCDKAKVVAIENLDGSESHITEVDSNYDKTFIYRVGEVVSVDNFDENRWNECAPGIHFFITREEAARY